MKMISLTETEANTKSLNLISPTQKSALEFPQSVPRSTSVIPIRVKIVSSEIRVCYESNSIFKKGREEECCRHRRGLSLLFLRRKRVKKRYDFPSVRRKEIAGCRLRESNKGKAAIKVDLEENGAISPTFLTKSVFNCQTDVRCEEITDRVCSNWTNFKGSEGDWREKVTTKSFPPAQEIGGRVNDEFARVWLRWGSGLFCFVSSRRRGEVAVWERRLWDRRYGWRAVFGVAEEGWLKELFCHFDRSKVLGRGVTRLLVVRQERVGNSVTAGKVGFHIRQVLASWYQK